MNETTEPTTTAVLAAGSLAGRLLEGDIVRVLDRRVLVALPTLRVWARVAIPQPYQPAVGDRVLVVVSEAEAGGAGGLAAAECDAGEASTDRAFVLGVLEQFGEVALRTPGDLVLQAGGRVVVRGRAGIALETDRECSVRARVFRTIAESVRERLGEVFRTVRGLISTRAKETALEVEDDSSVRAGRIVQKAKGHVRIDGSKIHLG
jgi:co-chaperonin GroES (HSP10)